MGLFGKVFGKEDKKDSCCCDMEIVEVPEARRHLRHASAIHLGRMQSC